MRITFEEVSVKGTRKWVEGGKRKQKTKTFFQTLSPFNKNQDGSIKTKNQIMDEILADRRVWLDSEDEPLRKVDADE